jgi:tetratricopeptide (TPR) repeat protein
MLMVWGRLLVAAAMTAVVCVRTAGAPAAAQTTRELRDRATDFAYNLDHDEAIRLLRQAIAQEPSNPANHRALASTLWLNILFRRGAVTVDHYLGSFSAANVALKSPPPELDAEFRRESAKAVELSEQETAAHPKDALAHLDLGTSLGLQASYMASVEGKLMAGFKAAKRSYDECEQAMALDASRKEPSLVVGTYRYIVSTLSLPVRMMAYVAGFGGGKERGLKMIEDTAASPEAENRTDAQFALVLLYNREQRYDDALRVLGLLRKEYPRNRLVVLEIGATALRAGRWEQADGTLTEGMAMLANDPRPRMPGEDGLWHYKRGAARVRLNRFADAREDLAIALRPDSLAWVQGRAYLETARMAKLQGDTAAAKRSAASAITACEAGNDPICVDEARKIR